MEVLRLYRFGGSAGQCRDALSPHGVLLITHLLEVTIDVGWPRHPPSGDEDGKQDVESMNDERRCTLGGSRPVEV